MTVVFVGSGSGSRCLRIRSPDTNVPSVPGLEDACVCVFCAEGRLSISLQPRTPVGRSSVWLAVSALVALCVGKEPRAGVFRHQNLSHRCISIAQRGCHSPGSGESLGLSLCNRNRGPRPAREQLLLSPDLKA